MDKISTILVPFNFSESSKKALDYAVNFIGKNKKKKIILGYILEEESTSIHRDNFDEIVKKYDIKNQIEWLVTYGSLTKSLIKIQKEQEINLIIMGTSGTINGKSLKDTNTSKLVFDIDCPVLVVPESIESFQIKNIALVLGKEEIEDREALVTLLEISQNYKAKVHVVTIINTSESYGYSNKDAKNENTLEYYLEYFYSEHSFIENPDVLEGILNYVDKKEIDMIAIIPRNHTKKSEPSDGKLTQLLTLHSKVPVLTID